MMPTGKSSSGSLTLEPVLDAMSYSTLAEHCMGEICNYRRGEPSDERYGLELFRRATLENDQDAWIWLEYCFSDLVCSWIHRHPQRDLACHLDSDENYIARAFEKL